MSKAKARLLPTDREFMSHPAEWPRWPLLPLKRRTSADPCQCGFLVAEQGILTRVFLGTIFGLSREWRPANAKHLEYDSFDAIIQDGWRID